MTTRPSKERLVVLLTNGTEKIDVAGLKTVTAGDLAHLKPTSWVQGIEIQNGKIVLAVQDSEVSVDLSNRSNTIDIASAKLPSDQKPFGAFDDIVDQIFRTVIAAQAGDLLKNAGDLKNKKQELIRRLLTGVELNDKTLQQINGLIDIQGTSIVVNPVILRVVADYLATQAVREAA